METSVTRFARFVCDTEYEDLPEEVTDFVKALLLDTFGCAVAGVTSDKGKWGIDFGKRCFGGKKEATVFGYGEKLSAMGSAFVNAELINGLDFEAAGLHLPPFVIPPVLAEAEVNHGSGKDVIAATAISLEIGTRIARGLVKPRAEEGEKGVSAIAPVFGPSSAVFAGAAGASKMKGFNRDQTAHAIGLSGVLSPVLSQASMHRDLPVNSGKYLMAGWAAQTGMTAAELIQSGHRGNLQVLDSEYGYWRFTGQGGWDAHKAFEKLGQEWTFLGTTPYKRFPCCGMMHGGLECLAGLVEEHKLRPEEIEHITLWLDPTSSEAMFHNRDLENQIDVQFSIAYNMSMIANGIQPGLRWQDSETIHSPEIQSFMEKVSAFVHPEAAAVEEGDPRARIVKAEVKARGQVFEKELRYIKGISTAGTDSCVTEEERIRKFRGNVSLILPDYRADQALKALRCLEQAEDIGSVMELLHV